MPHPRATQENIAKENMLLNEDNIPDFMYLELKALVHELVVGNYQKLERTGVSGILSANEIKKAIQRYGRARFFSSRLVMPAEAGIHILLTGEDGFPPARE